MTLIHFDYSDSYRQSSRGSLAFMPHRRHAANETTILPKPFAIHLHNGERVVDLQPSDVEWVWMITERINNTTNTWFATIPDQDGTIKHTELIHINPSSLPAAYDAVEPAWWAEHRQYQRLVGDTVTTAKDAIAEAESTLQKGAESAAQARYASNVAKGYRDESQQRATESRTARDESRAARDTAEAAAGEAEKARQSAWEAVDGQVFAWGRGHTPADGTPFDDLPNGRWYVPTGAAATALGLPEVAHGSLLIHRHRGTDSPGLATFLTRTAPPRMWSYAWDPDGVELSGWHLHDDNYVASSNLTGSETLSELAPNKAYVVPTGAIATSLGLPEPVHGLLQVTRWGAGRTGAGVAVFTSREEPARMWSYAWHTDGTAMSGWLPMRDGTTVPATRRPQWITTFQDGHGWTHPYTPGATMAPDTTDYLMGTQSIRIDSGPGLFDIIRSPELNLDLRGKALVVLAKPHSGLSSGLRIYAGDIEGGNYAIWTMYRVETGAPLSRYGEWAQVRLVPQTYVGTGPDWANIQQIQIGTYDTQDSTTSWSVQAVGVADTDQRWPKGVISLTFDDGEHDIMQAARQYMTPRNMAGVAYVAKDWANRPGFVSDDDIRELRHTHGWTIGAHGTSVYTGYTPEELRTEWSEEKAWLNTLGIDAQHLAYVGGQYTAETIRVTQEFFKTGRSISAGLEPLPVGDPYRIRAVTGITDSGTGGHDIYATKLYIDRAVREGTWLNLVFHRLVDTPASSSDISWTAFADLLDYIQASGAAVRTPDELPL